MHFEFIEYFIFHKYMYVSCYNNKMSVSETLSFTQVNYMPWKQTVIIQIVF